MNADVELQLVVAECLPDGQGAVHRIQRSGKCRERLIPPRLDRLAVVLLDQLKKDIIMSLAHPVKKKLSLRHQRRVAHDVGEQDGGEAAL